MEKDNKHSSDLTGSAFGQNKKIGDFDITTQFVQEELSSILERAVDGQPSVYDAADDILHFTSRSSLSSNASKLSRRKKAQEKDSDSRRKEEPKNAAVKQEPVLSASALQKEWDAANSSAGKEEKVSTGKLTRKEKKALHKQEKEARRQEKKNRKALKKQKGKEEPDQSPAVLEEQPQKPKRRFLFDEPKENEQKSEAEPGAKESEAKQQTEPSHSRLQKKSDRSEPETDAAAPAKESDRNKKEGSAKSSKAGSLDKESAEEQKDLDNTSQGPRFRKASEIYGTPDLSDTDPLWTLSEPKPKDEWFSKLWKKYQAHLAKKSHYGLVTTLMLCLLLCVLVVSISALFITGPARVHDEKVQKAEKRMEEQAPGIQGITRNTFAYITYEGYTSDTLYWFDVNGELITSKPIQTLNYEKAKKRAADVYGVEPITIQLAYGYTAPVYEIEGETYLILLDYDNLSLIYERRNLE